MKNQTLFRTRKNIETILNSSPEAIYRFRSKWRKGSGAAQAPPRVREKIVAFLKEIEDLKYQQRDRGEWIEIFSRNTVSVFAYDILRFMFDIVTQTLYRRQWGALAAQKSEKGPKPSEKASI